MENKINYLNLLFICILFSFTLYTARDRVGRGYLVLRHSDAHFPPNSGRQCGGVQHRASPYYQTEKMKRLNISSFTVARFGPVTRLASITFYYFINYFDEFQIKNCQNIVQRLNKFNSITKKN